MANKDLNINVYANLTVPYEAAEGCCRLLEMWLNDDRPYRKIVCRTEDDGHWTLKLVRRQGDGKE